MAGNFTKYNANPGASPVDHRMSRQQRLLVMVFIASFALDVKGSVGGTVAQYLMAVVNTVVFLLLAVSCRVKLPRKGLAAFVFWGWMAFLLTGTIGAIVNATPFGHYIRIVYAFVLFLQGFLVVWWTARSPYDAGIIVSIMVAIAVVSLCFTAWWGFYFTGDSASSIRIEILSPLIPLLIVVTGYDLFFAKRRQLWAFIIMISILVLIALSVTRGQVLIIGFVIGLVLLAMLANAIRTARFPRPLMRMVVFGMIVTALGLAAATLFNSDVLGRWVHRSFDAGNAVNFWTRVAGVIGQYQALVANPLGWLTGQGFGSSYFAINSAFPWILKYMSGMANPSFFYPSEFMWMAFLFYGGFLIGPIAALILLVAAIRSFRLLGFLLQTQSWRSPLRRPLWVGVLGYFAFLGLGFTEDPFIWRLAPLFMGMCLGLIETQGAILAASAYPKVKA